MRYVLITAARNESNYIEATIRSIVAQTSLPIKWVIVSDGSTDKTDEIVLQYAARHAFITFLRLEASCERNFSSKVRALNYGITALGNAQYDFIGCLDADIMLEADYYERMLILFTRDPLLGVAGGFIFERRSKHFVSRPNNSERSVAGAVQLFRASCFRTIGAYLPLRYGGEDTVAEVRARMSGYYIQSFPQLRVYHQRRSGGSDRLLRSYFRSGLQDFYVGYHPCYEFLASMRRITNRPVGIGCIARLIGYACGYFSSKDIAVPRDQIMFLRSEQQREIRRVFSRLLRLGRS